MSENLEDDRYPQFSLLAQKLLDDVFSGEAKLTDPMSLYQIAKCGIKIADAFNLLSSLGIARSPWFVEDWKDRLLSGSFFIAEEEFLSSENSLILMGMVETYALAVDVMGGHDNAAKWIYGNAPYLGGTPRDILELPYGLQAIRIYLERILYGVYQ